MASKVNTKFVVTLGAALTIAFLVVGYVAYQSIKKSGEDYVKLGDKAMAESKHTEAIGLYARAVYKDQRNGAWIRKWIDAMEKDVPKSRAVYQEGYSGQYLRALQALADAERKDFEATRRLLDERWEIARVPPTLSNFENFMTMADEAIKNFQGDANDAKKLRRYRGLARVGQMNFNPDLKQEDVNLAREDLQAAFEADPTDREAVVALCGIDVVTGERARKRDDKETMTRLNDQAMARLTRFIAENPPAAMARAYELQLLAQLAGQAADKPPPLREVLQDRKSKVEELVAAVMAETSKKLDLGTVSQTADFARFALPHPAGKEAAEKVFEAAMKAKPENPQVHLMAAQAAIQANDVKGAMARYQHIVDMPDRPMSLAGVLLFGQRDAAVRLQVDAAFRQWEQAKDATEREAAAALAKKFRDEYVVRRGETDNDVLAMDARLMLIAGDVKGATTLLTRYTQQANAGSEQYPPSMALLGTLMMRQDNIGAAKQSFERVLQLDKSNVQSMISLATIADRNQEYGEALKYTQMALRYRPEDAGLKEQETILQQLASGKLDDPVVKLMVEVNREATGIDGSPEKAIATLRAGMAKDNGKLAADIRPHVQLIQLLHRSGDKPTTLAAVDAAMARFTEGPMAENLKKFKDNLTNEDPVKTGLEQIDKASAPDLQKHLARHQLFAQAGNAEDAAKALAEAAKLAPEDAQVVDRLFNDAMVRDDKEELIRLADLAVKKNLDQVGGQLYRARLLLTQEKLQDAVVELRGVIERDKLSLQGWRLLGATQGRLNNADAAVEAFSKAVEIKPNDLASVNGLLRGLIASQRLPEALTVARKSEKIAGSNPDFLEALILIESNAPLGNKERAMQLRKSIAQNKPDNAENTAALAILQMQQRKWADAKVTLDGLRADEQYKNDVAALEAKWYALQEKYAEAEKVYDDLIAAMPADKLNEGAYLSASNLFMQVGQHDRAAAYLEKGRAHQKTETMYIDRSLGDVFFTALKHKEAVEAYKRVLDAGSKDEGDAVAKRMLECYLVMKDYEKFDALIASMGERARGDSTMLVLAAEAANSQGDSDRAAPLFDKAVASDSKNFMVFVKRAEFSRKDESKVRDAIADYEQAARLNAISTLPRLRLSDLYFTLGRNEEGLDQLAKALAIDPANDSMREELINLRLRMGQEAEVVDLITEAVKLKPDDARWLLKGGDLMARLRKPDRAVEYLVQAWEKEKSLRVAIPYVTALLEKNREVDLATAAKVAAAPELKNEDEMPMHILRAMVIFRSKVPQRADDEVAAALSKVDQTNGAQVQLFMSGLDSVYGEPALKLAFLKKVEPTIPFKSWMAVQVCAVRMKEPAIAAKQAADMEKMADASPDPNLKLGVYSLLASYHFSGKRWPQAVDFNKKGLELSPNDLGLLNNCAYIMAERLKQYSDALPLAERAMGLAPDNPTVLDTLGTVQLGLRNCAEAESTLRRAVEKSQTDNDRAPAMIHLARACKCLNKTGEAQDLRTKVRQLFEAQPPLEAQFGDDLKQLSEELDGH